MSHETFDELREQRAGLGVFQAVAYLNFKLGKFFKGQGPISGRSDSKRLGLSP